MSATGLSEPLAPVAEWLATKLKRRITVESLQRGGELHRKDGWSLDSLVASGDYPHLMSIELVHPDLTVKGRRWHSEIGLHQASPSDDVILSALVQTSEISSRVTAPVEPGAPKFVTDVLAKCRLSSAAIGGRVTTLNDDDAEAFRYVVFDQSREYPIVVLSPTSSGAYAVDSQLLSQLLIGIADLVLIPLNADTFWLARSVGREFIPYHGAATIIYPSRSIGRPNVRTLTRHDISSAGLDARSAARELFSLVLHRTNLPLSWRHLGPARVREEILRRDLEKKRVAAEASGDSSEFTKFLEDYAKSQEALAIQALAEKKLIEEQFTLAQRNADDAQRELGAKVDALKYQLDSRNASVDDDSPYAPEDSAAVAETVASVVKRNPTPEDCLKLIEHFFGNRITILPEAWTAAREAVTFKHGEKLYGLFHALATTYWLALSGGTPDQEARKVFGNAYAAKESEGVANNKEAKRKRTFRYAGEDHFMVKHLRIGVKDSAAESIRIHFEWFAERERLVVGHCGAHLPFG